MNRKTALFAAILALLLFLCTGAAADAQRATALITGGNADRVHLRARPSKQSDSLGLYFEGTPVAYSGSLEDAWVSVRIGSEEGYMMSAFLSDSLPEASSLRSMTVGVVRAASPVSLHTAPASGSQALLQLPEGTQVVILGETDTHWYYASVNGLAGYVRADSVSLAPIPRVRGQITPNVLAVLTGEEAFWHADAAEYMTLREVGERCFGGSNVTFPHFAIADVDQDANDELILTLSVDEDPYYGYLVLKSADGTVWGNEIFYRAMLSLRADGTFSFSSGAADNGFGYLRSAVDQRQIAALAESVSSDETITYWLNGQQVSEALYREADKAQEQKPEVIWYDLTAENLSVLRKIIAD